MITRLSPLENDHATFCYILTSYHHAIPSEDQNGGQYKYHGNMMDWPGFSALPPFTGLMVETGKNVKTAALRTFERKTSFGTWTGLSSTLNAVISIAY